MFSNFVNKFKSTVDIKKNQTQLSKNIQINFENVPNHIAFIMDGNRRWAKKNNLLGHFGHKKGAERIPEIMSRAFDHWKVKYLTFFAFSVENWSRPKPELEALLSLLHELLARGEKELTEKSIRFHTIGDLSKFSKKTQRNIQKLKDITKKFTEKNFVLALNYGSRDEIVRCFKNYAQDVLNKNETIADFNWEKIRNYLDFKDIPDPDLIIRTSGERRLSNFLLLQSAYSELYFTDDYWPEFTNEKLDFAISDFQTRKRRFGK